MQIESLSIAAIQRWNNKRLAIHAKSDVREKSRVEDLVNRFPVARSSIGDTTEFSALGQAIQCFLVEKLAAAIFESTNRGLAQSTTIAVSKIETPLMRLRIVQTQG